jgi:predicted patatin/cPLA2 family phospholipase
MLDGGIVDSIPVEYAMSQGYEKQVVILTRNKGYRKKDSRMPLAKITYKQYPNLQAALHQRNTIYNKTMELIEKNEDEGKILVIRPVKPIEVGRMEKNTDKLRALYQEGYDIAEQIITSSRG